MKGSQFDNNGLFLGKTDKGIQIATPCSMNESIWYDNYCFLMAAHPGGRKLYYKIRKDFYQPELLVNCYATVRKCPHYALKRLKVRKDVMRLPLLPSKEPLKSVSCIDTFGAFIRTLRKNTLGWLWRKCFLKWPRKYRWMLSLPPKSRST